MSRSSGINNKRSTRLQRPLNPRFVMVMLLTVMVVMTVTMVMMNLSLCYCVHMSVICFFLLIFMQLSRHCRRHFKLKWQHSIVVSPFNTVNCPIMTFFQCVWHFPAYLNALKPVAGAVLSCACVTGCLGFTFQLALVQDLLSMMTLHIYCFYVYAARWPMSTVLINWCFVCAK